MRAVESDASPLRRFSAQGGGSQPSDKADAHRGLLRGQGSQTSCLNSAALAISLPSYERGSTGSQFHPGSLIKMSVPARTGALTSFMLHAISIRSKLTSGREYLLPLRTKRKQKGDRAGVGVGWEGAQATSPQSLHGSELCKYAVFVWGFYGTHRSGDVSNSFACFWDLFPPTWLPPPALI